TLHDLLRAAPAGWRSSVGSDPYMRPVLNAAAGCATGKPVAPDPFYPHTAQPHKACVAGAALCDKCNVGLVAIGNGTASRETEP
ncbi:RNA-binding transcriptional accessory protein, partial [Klebsiella pneumoniae]